MNSSDTNTANCDRLRRFIEAESETLLGTLRVYVLRAGLAGGEGAARAAADLLSDLTVEALEHADRFRPSGQPMAWLLGIAANLIKRRQARRATDHRREPLVRDLYTRNQALLSEGELFDRLAAASAPGPADAVEMRDRVSDMLSHVSESDRQVLHLAILHDLSGEELAAELGVTPGAARVRLHRALNRLLELMEDARTTDELLKAEQQLTEREATIESIKGRMQYLEQAARLASIHIELQPYPPSQPVTARWRPAEAVRRAFETLVDSLRGVGDFLIFFAIAILPWAAVVGLAGRLGSR